jgi:hypothetical protein
LGIDRPFLESSLRRLDSVDLAVVTDWYSDCPGNLVHNGTVERKGNMLQRIRYRRRRRYMLRLVKAW